MIKNVNERKKASEEKERLYEEWRDLVEDTDFDNDEDAAALWKQIEKLDADIEAFDKKYPDALKSFLGKATKDSEDSLKNALAEIDKLNIPEAQKAALRKSVAQAAKTFSGKRKRVYDDVSSLEDLESDLEEARARRDAMKAKMENMALYEQEKYWEALDRLENEIRDLESDVSVQQRIALKKAQDAKAAVNNAVEEVKAVTKVHEPESAEDTNTSVDAAKAYYETAYKAFTKYVAPHVPNDASVENALKGIADSLATEADVARHVASTYSRDPRKRDAILTLASVIDLPSRAFTSAMSGNDDMKKVADWRDVLTNIKNKFKGKQPPTNAPKAPVNPLDVSSGDEDADADAKAFLRVMRDLEPKYEALFNKLPVGAATKPLLASVAAFEREIKHLHEDGLANKDDKEMYPGYGHILMAVSEAMSRYAKLMRKALTK